jgi:hypothetical protein
VTHPLPPPVTSADRAARRRRIAELRRLVARGVYRVPAEAVAEAFVRHLEEARQHR